MLWLRKGLAGLLSSILFVSLVGFATTTSIGSAFSSPTRVTTWVEQSNFYPSVLSKASSDTAQALGYTGEASQLAPVIQKIMSNVFTEADFNNDIASIINSNFSWLKGKSATPSFDINLSSVKTAFANQLASYVGTRYAALPKCSLAQAESLTSSANPLTIACQVPTITAASLESQITNAIESNSIVIKNPDITPSSITRSNGTPYYTKFNAPSLYKHLNEVPDILALVILVCLLAIFFISLRKKWAVRKIGISFTLAGISLLALVIGSNEVESMINSRIAKHSSLTTFETSLSTLVHKIVGYVNGIDTYFAIGYLILGIGLIGFTFWYKRQAKPSKQPAKPSGEEPDPSQPVNTVPDMTTVTPSSTPPVVQPTAPTLNQDPNSNQNQADPKRRLIQ